MVGKNLRTKIMLFREIYLQIKKKITGDPFKPSLSRLLNCSRFY